MRLSDTDTIAAIATPPGQGGIGIVRVSGPAAPELFRLLFRPRRQVEEPESHRLYYGHVVDGAGQVLDEALAVLMRAPRTYTRDHVLELHCHGSAQALEAVLAEVLARGARPAEPGEFTKRAWLNGRIGLTQAEAVVDLLGARTRAGHHLALSHLQGRLQERLEEIRGLLVDVLAMVEVAIDFPDDEEEILEAPAHGGLLDRALELLDSLLAGARQGRLLRQGALVAIVGRPNVGKSSLLNALLAADRALVTEIPGTTRDLIEDSLDLDGIPVRLVDTAGIRDSGDQVEALGIERAWQCVREADLVLFLVDARAGVTAMDQEICARIASRRHLLVCNKRDLAPDLDASALARALPGEERRASVLVISARHGQGLDSLRSAMRDCIMGPGLGRDQDCAPNIRQARALSAARECCQRARHALAASLGSELVALEVGLALEALADLAGETTAEDVLERIFSSFCIGK